MFDTKTHPATECLTIPATNKCKPLFLENLVNLGSRVYPQKIRIPPKKTLELKKNGGRTGRPETTRPEGKQPMTRE